MNNYELHLKFMEIAAYNIFDSYSKLKEFKKEYKQSDFYKSTHMPIQKAYKLFNQTLFTQLYFKLKELIDPTLWSYKLNQVMEDIDDDSLNNFMSKITAYFNLNNLMDEKGELQSLIQQIKNII